MSFATDTLQLSVTSSHLLIMYLPCVALCWFEALEREKYRSEADLGPVIWLRDPCHRLSAVGT